MGCSRSLSCLRRSGGRSIRELPGDTELAFEDPVPRVNVHVPFAAAMMCGHGRSSGRDILVVVATMARNFDSGAVVVLVVTVVRAEVSCVTLVLPWAIWQGHMLCFKCLFWLPCWVVVVVTAVALVVVVTTTSRVFRSPSSIIGTPAICQGHLATGTRAFARREVWVPMRSSQSPGTSKCQLGNWRFVSLA